jgi:hypothetical protein
MKPHLERAAFTTVAAVLNEVTADTFPHKTPCYTEARARLKGVEKRPKLYQFLAIECHHKNPRAKQEALRAINGF